MVLSVSPGAAPSNQAEFFKQYSNLHCISNDFWDHWKYVSRQMNYCIQWYPHIKQGHWPDADMLPFGKLRISSGVGCTSFWVYNKYRAKTQVYKARVRIEPF